MRQFAYILGIAGFLSVMAWGWYLYSQAGHYVVVDHAQLPGTPSQVIYYELDEDVDQKAPSGPPLWSTPRAQDFRGQWVYDLFTPPTIWRDPVTGSLEVQPWDGEQGGFASELKLVACKRDLFRVQFEGFANAKNAEHPRLFFVDVPTSRRMVGHVGDTFGHTHVRILAFNAEELTLCGRPRSSPEKNPTVIVLDEITGEEIVLRQKDPCYTESWTVQLEEGGQNIHFHEIGEAQPSRQGVLILKQVDFDRGIVTLERKDTQTGSTELAVLKQ